MQLCRNQLVLRQSLVDLTCRAPSSQVARDAIPGSGSRWQHFPRGFNKRLQAWAGAPGSGENPASHLCAYTSVHTDIPVMSFQMGMLLSPSLVR